MSAGQPTRAGAPRDGLAAGCAVRAEQHLVAGAAPQRARLRAAPAIAALAIVALVAALSAGLPSRVGSGAGLSAQAVLGDAATIVLVLALTALAYMAYSEWAGRERRRPERRARRRRRPRLPRPTIDPQLLVVPLLLAAALALVLALVALLGHPGPRLASGGASFATGTPVHRAARAAAGGGSGPPVDPAALIAAAAVVALAGAWLAVRARRRRRPARGDGDAQDALVAAVDDSLEDLGRETDPRRAVIKAYDRMERALAASGAARERAETPLEYLRRALTAVRASQTSIRRLTDLFEQARFSAHTIDAAMKGEAIIALSALRAELDGAAATGGAA